MGGVGRSWRLAGQDRRWLGFLERNLRGWLDFFGEKYERESLSAKVIAGVISVGLRGIEQCKIYQNFKSKISGKFS